MLRPIVFAATLACSLALAGNAQAYWGCGYGANYFGYGLPMGWYTGVQGRMPPYFALHPPVYYSGEIVRIPYGNTPFAYPYGTVAPMNYAPPAANYAPPMAATEPAEPVMIENEFVQEQNRGKTVSVTRTASSEGEFIDNPYYRPETRVATRSE